MGRKKLFCFGYGYTCDYLGHELLKNPDSWIVAGTTRSREKAAEMRKRGVDSYIFDYEHPLADPAEALRGTTHLLISTPPDDEGDPAFLMHAAEIAKIGTLQWVGYLSTTGVYGNRDGGWVDETSEAHPMAKRGSKRLKAEEQWTSLFKASGVPLHIFRLAGIYGPGRSALDSVRAGVARRIDKPGHAFSRIHVEDIVQVLCASMDKPSAGAIYNVSDDDPVPSHTVIAHACEMLGRVPPPLIPYKDADLAPITRSFYADNKRVKNDKIKTELGVSLKYPTYREGLKACLEAENYAVSLFQGLAG